MIKEEVIKGLLWLWPDAFVAESEGWRAALDTEIAWSRPTVRVFGQNHPIPREQAWYGEPGCVYAYSGLRLTPHAWTPTLLAIREAIGALTGRSWNGCLLNRYRSGHDRMGWHRDDEPELGPDPALALLSLGATRDIRFRCPATGEQHTLALPDGSLLLMGSGLQAAWEHQIPVRRRVSGERLSATFRYLPGGESR